jgi:hypothetical protein
MSSQAAIFSGFRPKITKSASRQSTEICFWDADSWLTDVLQNLRDLERLTTNWDSYGSAPPQLQALQAARQFLASVPTTRLPAPSVSAIAGGGVGFHWKVGGKDLEIEFLPDGNKEFLRTTNDDESSIVEGPLDTPEDQKRIWNWLSGK